MTLIWLLSPYTRQTSRSTLFYQRVNVMNEYTASIQADGGTWQEVEVLGNHAIIKARYSASAITAALASDIRLYILPTRNLNTTLADLTEQQKTDLIAKIISLGYTITELRAALGNDIALITFGELLRFIATRRIEPRYDTSANDIVFDGVVVIPESVDALDGRVQ